jgi:serine/threonine protein kinase
MEEMELLARLRHPAIVQLFGACADPDQYFMVGGAGTQGRFARLTGAG